VTVPAVNSTLNTSGAVNTVPAGSVSAPAITTTGDTNTGIFFPAADTIAFTEGGVESMRIDSSGNVGIGTSSPSGKLHVAGAMPLITGGNGQLQVFSTDTIAADKGGKIALGGVSGEGGSFDPYGFCYVAGLKENATASNFAGYLSFGVSNSGGAVLEMVRINSSGNVGIGTTNPTAKFTVNAGAVGLVSSLSDGIAQTLQIKTGSDYVGFFNPNGGSITFRANDGVGEFVRINDSGNLLVGTTVGTDAKFMVSGSVANNIARFINTNASPYGPLIQYGSGVDPNGTSNEFIDCRANLTTLRLSVRSNGGIANYSGNNVNLSDRREKTNFNPAKNYLDAICSIPVQTFNYIDQNTNEDDGLTLGVVAQDVQTVAPELVTESNWGTKEEPKMRLSIYQTDLQYALMKCIQEQQALITQLQADVATLKGAA
jgi:hypothetical protein